MIGIGKSSWPVVSTLFHELGHVTDDNVRENIQTKTKLQPYKVGNRFYEYTNTIFEKLVSEESFYKDDNAMQVVTSGYESLAPLGSMLASALGVSEVEFARIKDKGKEYEEHLLEKIFPDTGDGTTPHGAEVLENIKKIFNQYELVTDNYQGRGKAKAKKEKNQTLLNEMYTECIDLMTRRIETELQHGDIEDENAYKKQQMFYLKKLNFNYRSSSKSSGRRFAASSIVHDIGFCSDNLSKADLKRIASDQIAMADFGFDNSTLNSYTTMMTVKEKRESFFRRLQVSLHKSAVPQLSNTTTLELDNTKDDMLK